MEIWIYYKLECYIYVVCDHFVESRFGQYQ